MCELACPNYPIFHETMPLFKKFTSKNKPSGGRGKMKETNKRGEKNNQGWSIYKELSPL
jgi:hypothetical protein